MTEWETTNQNEMRPQREKKIITSHLEGFVDLKNNLEVLLNEISNILSNGESWLQGNEEFGTFSKFNHFLGFEFTSCLNKLSIIAGKIEDSADECHANEQNIQDPNKTCTEESARKYTKENLIGNKDSQNFEELLQKIYDKLLTLDHAVEISKHDFSTLNTKYDKLCKSSDKMSAKVKTLKEKVHIQDENIETKYNKRLDEITTELHTASDYIQAMKEHFSEKSQEMEKNFNAELIVMCKNFETKYEHNTEIVFEKLKGFKNELTSQTKTIDEIKREKACLSTKVTELDKNILDTTKKVENMSILIKNNTDSNEKVDVHNESLFLKGNCETMLSVWRGSDLHKRSKRCMKNSGHSGFIPVEKLTFSRMPEGYCKDDLHRFVQHAAGLTVKIDVKMTSPHRQSSDPFYSMRSKANLRTGSGRITNVLGRRTDMHGLPVYCECKQCKSSSTDKKEFWEFEVYTAAQVVFDDIEARHTSLILFYDSEKSQFFVVDDVKIVDVNFASDLCKLKFATCDERVANRLIFMVESLFTSWDAIEETYKDSRDIHKLCFIVSHPHGCFKQVSFGHWVDRYQMGIYNKFTYTTCTCPGSSGAAVYCLGFKEGGKCVQLVHSGSLSHKLNYSGTSGDLDFPVKS